MIITDDVTFAFDKIPQGRHLSFSIDFVIDTATPPTITLDSRVINTPTLPTMTNGLRVVLNFIGVVDDVSTRFIYIGGTVGTGSGGITFPITPPVDVRGNVSTTQNIDLSLTTAHSTTMTLTGNITITFSNFPATANQIEWEVEIKQDATGGRAITWPPAVTPVPVIDTGAGKTSIVVLRTNDAGTIIRTLLAPSVSAGGGEVFTWTADHSAGTFDLTNLDRLRFVVDSGVPASSADPSIFLDASGDMVQNVAALDSIIWKANNIEMAKIIEVAAGVYRLDMLDHSIDNAQDIRFDDTSGAIVFAGTDPAIGYDSVAARLLINMPTGGNLFITNNNVIGTTQINNNSLAANIVNANDVLQLGVDATVPTAEGEFRNDGVNTFVFSGGAVRNLSNIGVSAGGANVFLSNLTSPTSINQSLLPQAGKLLGNSGNVWSSATVNKYVVGTAGTILGSENSITANATTGMRLNTPSGDIFDFRFNDLSRITLANTELSLTGNAEITNATGLTLSNAGFSPIVNGEFRLNGTNVEVFTGGGVKSLTDIGSGNQTPILQDVDYDGFDIQDISNIEFRVTTGAPAAGVQAIWATSADMIFNVPTGDEFSHRIQGVDKFVLGTTFGTFSVAIVITGNLNVNSDVTLGNTGADSIFPLGSFASDLTFDNATDIIAGTGTGTRIATATGQKIGFWGNTPVVQQSVASDTLANLYVALRASGFIA